MGVRTASTVPTIYGLNRYKENDVYPCTPQFYYIKVGLKWVKIIWGCFRDDMEYGCFILRCVISFYQFELQKMREKKTVTVEKHA